jgi:hypothetical protein
MRIPWLAGLGLAGLACVAGCGEGHAPAPASLATDERLAVLLAPCERAGHYDVDLADIVPVLIEVLEHGDHAPLARAQTELGRMGARALPALERMIDAAWNEPFGAYSIRNALGAVAQSEDPGARALLVRCLEHRDEEVRMLAVRALPRHGLPEHFERVLALVPAASPDFHHELALLLHDLDAPRAEDLYLDWLERGQNPLLMDQVLERVALSQRPEVAERCRRALEHELELGSALWLAAPAARAGDERALELLRTAQHDPNPATRERALRALLAAELFEQVERALPDEPWPRLRLQALAALDAAGVPGIERILAAAAQDPDPEASLGALRALARRGDAGARERGLALLDPARPLDLDLGMRILEAAWAQDPALGERALERLLAAYPRLPVQEGRPRPLGEHAQLLQAIGRVPVARATQWLLELARERPDDVVQGQRAHRWLCLQAGNGGPAAQALLFDELGRTSEPRARLDLLEAASAGGGDAARAGLFALLENPSAAPLEVLYAASRLVLIGPASEVAWRLKRAALRIEDPAAKRALQCLLWAWYPAPR